MATRSWDNTSPADADNISNGATKIRQMKVDVEERWGFPVSGYTNLSTAIASLGATKGYLLIDQDTTTDSSPITIPANLTLAFIPGYKLTIASGHTLNVSSANVHCPDVQAFIVTGTLTFAAGAELRSTWFVDIATCEAAFAGEGIMVIPNGETDTDAATDNTSIIVVDQRTTEGSARGYNRVVVAGSDGQVDVTSLAIAGTAVTSTAAELNKLDGTTATTADLDKIHDVTATAAELNHLDGITASVAELNIMDGVTATASELNHLDGITATTAELNKVDGFTGTYEDLNYAKDLRATGVTATEFDRGLDGLTATAAELNHLDGITATVAELNHTDGVTSAIQTQLNTLTTNLANTTGGNLGTGEDLWVDKSGTTLRFKTLKVATIDDNSLTFGHYELRISSDSTSVTITLAHGTAS